MISYQEYCPGMGRSQVMKGNGIKYPKQLYVIRHHQRDMWSTIVMRKEYALVVYQYELFLVQLLLSVSHLLRIQVRSDHLARW